MPRRAGACRSCQTLGLMATSAEIQKSFALAEWIAAAIDGLAVSASLRHRSAGACFSIAQDHHLAITILVEAEIYSSAFALVRPLFEAYVRGLWLAHCATDEQLLGFSAGKEPPRMSTLLAAVESTEAFEDGQLSNIKGQSWGAMCAYTHTGSLQVQRWNTETAIEQNFPPEELAEVLNFSGSFALLSALGMATLANNEDLELKVLERSRRHAQNEP